MRQIMLRVLAAVALTFSPISSEAQEALELSFLCSNQVSFSARPFVDGQLAGTTLVVAPIPSVSAELNTVISADATAISFAPIELSLNNGPITADGFFDLGLQGELPFSVTADHISVTVPAFNTALSPALEFAVLQLPASDLHFTGSVNVEGQVSPFDISILSVQPKSSLTNLRGTLGPNADLSIWSLSVPPFLDFVVTEEFTSTEGEILSTLVGGRSLLLAINQFLLS